MTTYSHFFGMILFEVLLWLYFKKPIVQKIPPPGIIKLEALLANDYQ
jgi:hypothetical protein